MSLENDFLAWAIGAGANVESQESYASDPNLGQGYATGQSPTAVSFNKIVRQSSFMVAAFAAFLNYRGYNANDDSNLSEMIATILAALQGPHALINLSPSSTIWTVPAGCTNPRVRMWGGGGGGGAMTGGGPGVAVGGGGGGYTEFYITTTPGANLAYQIGLGGTGGNQSTPNGGPGGYTNFQGFSAQGGGGGPGGASGEIPAAGAPYGGTATGPTGAFIVAGQYGLQGIFSGGVINIGQGGSAYGFSPYPGGQGTSSGAPPQYALGSQGAISASGAAVNGSAGGKGIILIEY